MYEPITRERLKRHIENLKYYKRLIVHKEQILSALNAIKSVDFSKDRVINGNSKRLSEQENYVLRLEKINRALLTQRQLVINEQNIIKTQISRIGKIDYIKVLALRYLYCWEWKRIIKEFFEFEPDYEEQKDYKYRDKIYDWHNAAILRLEKINNKPYIPIKQQHLI